MKQLMMILACVLLSGCSAIQSGFNMAAETVSGEPGMMATNAAVVTPPVAPANPPTPAPMPPAPVTPPAGQVVYVPGDMRDKKPGSDTWLSNWHGADVRISVNDGTHLPGVGVVDGWYCLDPSVVPEGAIALTDNAAGEGIITVTDFTSTRTGARYHCCGVKIRSDRADLLPVPCNVGARLSGTTRIMLGTVKAP